MVAEYTVRGDTFVVDKARPWMQQRVLQTGASRDYELASDGKRVVAAPRPETPETKGSVHVIFLVDVFDELKRAR